VWPLRRFEIGLPSPSSHLCLDSSGVAATRNKVVRDLHSYSTKRARWAMKPIPCWSVRGPNPTLKNELGEEFAF
jgi:hypothetical protein